MQQRAVNGERVIALLTGQIASQAAQIATLKILLEDADAELAALREAMIEQDSKGE